MIAVTQARGIGPGKLYLDKALARGKTRTEGLRLLRRRLSHTIYAVTAAGSELRRAGLELLPSAHQAVGDTMDEIFRGRPGSATPESS